jgi:putative membrane protein
MLKPLTYAMLALGLLTAIAMVAWQGAGIVLATLALAGWSFLLVVVWYAIAVAGMGLSWSMVFPPGETPGLRRLVYLNYLGSSINSLLPVAAVGGDLVKGLMLFQRGVNGPLAGASVLADKAAQVASQLAFGLMGVGALIYLEAHPDIVTGLLGGTLFFCALLGAFFWMQGKGMFGFAAQQADRLAGGRLWADMIGSATELDRALDRIYRHHARIAWACWWRLAVRFSLVAEVWYLARLMGHPIGWVEAMMLESLVTAVRGMAFVVPAGLGAQEGAFILLAHSAGLPTEVALAISLAKRGREIVCGAPALLALQWGAGKRLAEWWRGA